MIIKDSFIMPEMSDAMAIFSDDRLFDADATLEPIRIGKLTVAPWGERNDLPQRLIRKVSKCDVASSNLIFNTNAGYGLGPVPMKKIIDGSSVRYEEITDGPEAEFFEDNDIQLFFLEQLNDMNWFWNTFPELIMNEKKTKIVSIRSKEATFSRWTSIDRHGEIKHLYSSKWPDATPDDITVSETINEYNPLSDITQKAKKSKEPRFVYPVYMPAPGHPYYANAPWWSIFESGSFDIAVAISAVKKTILKNRLGIRFIIYISKDYFEEIFKKERIDPSDKEAVETRIDTEKQKFNEFLAGTKGKGMSLMTYKKLIASGTGVIEDRFIEIVEVKNNMEGGEFLSDMEEANNTICYAMGVHPSLVGAVPGKNKGGFSGSDKRELFLIKQALMRPAIDRILAPFKLIKKVNSWNRDSFVVVNEYVLTTLDQNKTGKTTSINPS